jgi:F0F1-type ATP synthase membrane subunit c/vacuolar-type H+-ATPase subunit K
MKREFRPSSSALPDLRRKLLTITAAFVGAQLGCCLVGYLVFSNIRSTAPREAGHTLIISALMFVAISSLAASFVVVTALARQATAETAVPSLTKQLILGSAMSETPALIGLVLFFLGSHLVVLVALAGMSGAAVVAHYLRVSSKLEKLQHGAPL